MLWVVGAIALVYALVALLTRLTEAPIMRRRVNRGTDRYRASMRYIAADEYCSVVDIVIGSGSIADPMSKRLWIPEESSHDGSESAP